MVARQHLTAARDDLPGRLVAEDPAVVRRVADGGADVGAGVQPRQPHRERRRRPAGGAAGRSGQVPRIGAGAVERVEALPVREHERDVRLAEDHGGRRRGTSRPRPSPYRRCCPETPARPRSWASPPGRSFPSRSPAGRRAGRWPRPPRAAGPRRRPPPCAVEVLPDDRVDRLVVPLHALEKVLEQPPARRSRAHRAATSAPWPTGSEFRSSCAPHSRTTSARRVSSVSMTRHRLRRT